MLYSKTNAQISLLSAQSDPHPLLFGYSVFAKYNVYTCVRQIVIILASLCIRADEFDSFPIGNLKDRFSRDETETK